MASALASRYAQERSPSGNGGGEGQRCGPPRCQSLPALGIPAGFSPQLGNKLSLCAYQNLRGAHDARLDLPPYASAPNKKPIEQSLRTEQTACFEKERLRPELQPPAGQMKDRKRGKRLVAENTNTLSHVDTLLWGCDIDGSDGILKQANSSIYKVSAGLNAKAERTPIYGDVAPHCVRTFGANGTTHWNNPRGAHQRVDPRSL